MFNDYQPLHNTLPPFVNTFEVAAYRMWPGSVLRQNPLQMASASPKEIEQPLQLPSSDACVSEASASPSASPSISASETPAPDDGATRHQRDQLLMNLRREGHSYKDIKRIGRFTEAESTLRGRYRAMSKEKSKRVRKPTWQAHDVCSCIYP